MNQLGIRLRTLREGLGISQAKFAEIISSTQSSTNRYENVWCFFVLSPLFFSRDRIYPCGQGHLMLCLNKIQILAH